MVHTDHFWHFRSPNEEPKTDELYGSVHELFSIALRHGGDFHGAKRIYCQGLLTFMDCVDVDEFSTKFLDYVLEKLGYWAPTGGWCYYFKEHDQDLDTGLKLITDDVEQLKQITTYAKIHREIEILGGENVRLADYFDVISGISTGGLVTAMLATPNEEGRPLFAAKDIKKFYLEHCPRIFPPGSNTRLAWAAKWIKALQGPKHDGVYLHRIIEEILQDKRLHETLTNVVIPTFDIKKMKHTIFSSYQLKMTPDLDAKLSDISIGTSAAPIYLPSHAFQIKDSDGKVLREFNLIDGGIVANNPTKLAINEVIMEITRVPIDSKKHGRYLVLSLGTGSSKSQEKYDAAKSSRWGVLGWFYRSGTSPLFDAFTCSDSEKTEYDVLAFFRGLHSNGYYMRIQDATLNDDTSTMDLATSENLENLVKVGQELLQKRVDKVNLGEGISESDHAVTNKMALKRVAEILHNSQCTKRGAAEM